MDRGMSRRQKREKCEGISNEIDHQAPSGCVLFIFLLLMKCNENIVQGPRY